MRKTKILLIVNSNADNSTIKNILELEKWIEVIGVTADQQRAIELTEEYRPDVAVIDFDLQETGLRTGELIMEKSPDTKIIALSIYDFIGDVKVKKITEEERRIAASFEWISKNSSPFALIDSIAESKTYKKPN